MYTEKVDCGIDCHFVFWTKTEMDKMKGLFKRSLAVVMATLVLMTSLSIITLVHNRKGSATVNAVEYTAVAGTSGDTGLLDKASSTSPSIYVDKTKYTVGEPIYVTASNGVYVGLYRADQTDYAHTKSIYWYYLAGNEGKAFDIRTGNYNADNPLGISPALFVGPYTAVLFATDDATQPVASVTFNIQDANGDTDDANSYITTNRQTYHYGETVVVTAKSSNNASDQAWVGVYNEGAVPSTTTALRWYYIVSDSIGRNWQGASVSLYGASASHPNEALDPGEYDVYLFGDSGYNQMQAKTSITIAGATASTDKTTYGVGENIIVSASSCTASSGAWVGIYNKNKIDKGFSANNPADAWYSLSAYSSGNVVLQNLANDNDISRPIKYAEPGEYIVYVFGDSGYNNRQPLCEFTIEEKVNGSFSNGMYMIDDINDGFANGTVVLEVDSDNYNIIGNTDVSLFWADAQGNPLTGYTALAKAPIDKNVVSIDMYAHTIIPEGAESLVAYVSYTEPEFVSEINKYAYMNADIVGTKGYKIDLPAGTVTYTGLDQGILSEFQMVSDLHVTSQKSESVDGGTLIDQWYHVNDNDHFEMMLNDIAENSPNSTGIFVNGDIANNGLAVEFQQVQDIYNNISKNEKIPSMYVSLGNHDSYPGDITEFVNYANSLGAEITSDAPYYAKDINGYKYIFLGGDNSDYYGLYSATENSNDAELSSAQLAWLDQQLADNETNNGGKPVFVMLHQAIENTVAGSFEGQDWDGVVNIDALKSVLCKYDNVILLGGHSHWELNSPNNIFAGSEDLPVAINTASVGYLWTDYDKEITDTYMLGTQGFYVRVYDDKVVFLGRDFENHKWIPSACYVIYNEDVKGSDLLLNVDDKLTVDEYLENTKGRALSFATTDVNTVQVDENGTITATGIGTAEIIVTAQPTDTEVITREKIKVTVSNETVSEEVENLLTGPLNLGEDFSAYIGYEVGGTKYVLTIPADNITTDRTSESYSVSQGFETSTEMTVYYPEFLQENNKDFSVRQFWDFDRQSDGSYVIINTWTNATHNATDPKVPYALDGGSYSYYSQTVPTADNDVENALTATRYYYDDPAYTDGEYASYYRWNIYKDSNDNYYLKSQHTEYILALNKYNDQHWFGKLDKVLTTDAMAQAGAFLDRISTTDNIKMSLFDYGKYINNNSYLANIAKTYRETGVNNFDASKNDNILWFNQDEWNKNYVVDGVASKGNDDVDIETIGRYTQYDSTPQMLKSLDSTGYPYVNNVTYHDWGRSYGSFTDNPAFGSDSGSLKYLFDKDMTYVTGDGNDVLTAENYNNGYYQSVRYDVGDSFGSGLFREDANGGMVYSSYMNAAYFDTSEFYTTGSYQPVKGQRFQIYDYVIRPYYHYYYNENTSYSVNGETYNGIYDTLIKSTRLNTYGKDSLFNDRYLRKSLRDYNSYNRNFLPFNYGHNVTDDKIRGDYETDALYTNSVVDPAQPTIKSTNEATKITVKGQQDEPYDVPAYLNETYADDHGASYTNSQETNLWFGMTMEFDFEIANNGQIRDMNGELKDMVFNFTGDDDVLVYIDNVLVLNVAGTHGAQMATINFATGNVAHPTDESCYPSVGIDTSESSTIKAKFEAAYAEAAAEDSNSILAGATLNEEMFEGNTFANGTRHTLKFFYLERGGSRSFCDLYFNMETLPSSGFEVEKKSVDAQGNDVTAEDNSDYTFIITGYTNEGDVLRDGTYTYDVVNTSTHAIVSANLKVDQGNTITLKSGQKAVFKDLRVDYKYTVTEIIDPCYVKGVTTYLDNVDIGNTPVIQDHLVSCTASEYIPVVENDLSNVTFVNTVECVSVSIKYYDREVVSGKPADMGEEPQLYVRKFYGSDIKFTDETHTEMDTKAMIADAGNALASGKFGGVENILDEYYLWLSQSEAENDIQKFVNPHTGKNYEKTSYHTNQYGQVQTDGEKWVDISDDGTEITTWLFNKPRDYKVTVYGTQEGNPDDLVPVDGTDYFVATGSNIYTGYYNQRFGEHDAEGDNEGVNDATNYLNSYNIPAQVTVNEEAAKIYTAETIVKDGKNLSFLYWAFDAEGKEIASTNMYYGYRITGDTTLYAIYGEKAVESGVTVSENESDVFSVADSNGNSVEYVRLNTVLNPYGYEDNFHIGGDYPEAGDGIKDVAVVYVNVKNDAFDADNLSDEQLQQLRSGVQQIVSNAQNYGTIAGKAIEVTVEKAATEGESLDVTEEDITLIANGFKYKVAAQQDDASAYGENEVSLTTKNRVQFTTTFKKSQLTKLRLFTFAAIRVVENGESNWVVSDNYVDYNLGETLN